MLNQKRISVFALITLLALLANLMFPASVLADDEVPPPATEEIILDEEPAPQTEPQLDSVSETLEQLPENTEIVVLDESGAPLPLVTEEAQEVFATGDPIWCVDGTPPDPTDPNCSPAFANMTAMIGWLNTNNPNQPGTIWIEDSYDSSVNDPALLFVYLDGATLTNMANNSLTLQGGWSGTFDDTSITGTSEFNNMIWILNWNSNVTINNIFSTGVSGSGIDVETTGDINLNNITANNNTYGAVLDNCVLDSTPECTGTGDVNLNNVTFNNNVSNGAQIISNGEINITNITANNNGNLGLVASNSTFNTAVNDVNINGNNQFNSNGSTGLTIYSAGNVTVNNSQASNSVNGDGITIGALGNITLNNVTANNNYYEGAYLDNLFGTGNVSINNSQFSTNGDAGIDVYSNGDITLNNVIANNNYIGASINNLGNVSVTNGQFNQNSFVGLGVFNGGQITVSNIVGNNNGFAGAYLDNTLSSSYAGITVSNSQFANNGGGIGAFSTGSIYLENIVSDGHISGSGLFTDGTVTIKCSTFSNNSGNGIELYAPELNLYGVTFINNGVDIDDATPGGSTINTFEYNCDPSTDKPKPTGGVGLPLNIVFGNNADLDCDNFSGTVLILPNGDKVTFKCPIDGSAILNRLAGEDGLPLPNELPEGVEYVSGLVSTTSPDGSDVALDGLVVTSFIIPENLKDSDFAILYWDGTEWLDLDTATFEDGRKIFNDGYVTEDGYFEALTNFSGNFVLVTK
jgi:hypothetical protein